MNKLVEKIKERIRAHFGVEGFNSQEHYEAHVGFSAREILQAILSDPNIRKQLQGAGWVKKKGGNNG